MSEPKLMTREEALVLQTEFAKSTLLKTIVALYDENAELKQVCKTTEDTALAVLAASSCEEHSRVSFQEFSRAEIAAGCAQCARRENAELRRWLGAAADLIYKSGPYGPPFDEQNGKVWLRSAPFLSLSRGEPVSEDVRRMYLGDEEL